MAKKKGVVTPLDGTFEGQKSNVSTSMSRIQFLLKNVKDEVERSNLSLSTVLSEQFSISNLGDSHCWTLKSGRKVNFVDLKLGYEDVINFTTITFEINGRDQAGLTQNNLQDLDTMATQQFYPVIGRRVGKTIDILDGSRRRAKFLLFKGEVQYLKLLVTDDDISVDDAKALAISLQSAKEHNLREIGLRCLAIRASHPNPKNVTQEFLAGELGFSQSKINRALSAASIDDNLISLFPCLDLLSLPDYAKLKKISEAFDSHSAILEFIEQTRNELNDIKAEGYELVQGILKTLTGAMPKSEPTKSDQVEILPVTSEGAYARKKVKGKKCTYEFTRLPSDIQVEIDLAIAEILQRQNSRK